MRIATRPLYNAALTSPYVVSASLFAMAASYRSFDGYVRHAKRFVAMVARHLPGWVLELYVDRSVPQAALAELAQPHVKIIEYHCAPFWRDGFHEGVFGTFARFLPLFSDRRSLRAILISDIDVDESHIKTLGGPFLRNELGGASMVVGSVLCRNSWMRPGNKVYFTAGSLLSTQVFPRRLLYDFLRNPPEMRVANRRNAGYAGALPYGADEIFLNTVFYDYLAKRKANLLVHVKCNMSTVLSSIFYKMEPRLQRRYEAQLSRVKAQEFAAGPPDEAVKLLQQLRPLAPATPYEDCIATFLSSPCTGNWVNLAL